MSKKIAFLGLLFSLVIYLSSCSRGKQQTEEQKTTTTLNIRESADASTLNPINFSGATSGVISTYLYQTLATIDFQTLKLTPLLANAIAVKKQLKDGQVRLSYCIRKEARWDDGTAITAKDVAFSLKLLLLPNPESPISPLLNETIDHFEFDAKNPRCFSIICKHDYLGITYLGSEIVVLPQSVFDSTAYLNRYSVKDITELTPAIYKDSTYINFLEILNSQKFKTNPHYLIGSGPYRLKKWESGRYIILQKKQNWWGDKIKDNTTELQANIDRLVFHIIPDETTALSALKSGSIDLISSVSSKNFIQLDSSKTIKQNYNLITSPLLAYYALALNLRNPVLSDVNNRKALAHLVDIKKIIDVVTYGYAEPIIGPIPKSFKEQYNFNIKPYDFNIEKAKDILKQNGWEDSNHDGILDKDFHGKRLDFILSLLYNSGSESKKEISLIVKQDAAKAGIKINLVEDEWSNYLEKCKNSDFDICFAAKMLAPTPRNQKELFHSESITEGTNITAFSSPIVDQLIDSINITEDASKRAVLNRRFQKIIHDKIPYIYLYSPKSKMVISKKFKNFNLSALRPGYWAPGFKTTSP